MSLCTNHSTIPNYQSIFIGKDNTRLDKPDLVSINDSLAKLTPKGRKIAGAVAIIAISVIAMITAAFISTPLLILSSLFTALICGKQILDYQSYKSKIKKINQEISAIFKEYANEFTFLEKKSVPLIALNSEDFNLIKPYCSESNPLKYVIRENAHFKFEGGVIGKWLVTPLKLEQVCKVSNSDKVIGIYKPWIDLLN